jgi:hypothetical protein
MDALPIRAGSPDTGTGQPFTGRQTTASPGSVQDGFEAAYIAGGRQGRSDEGGSSTVPEEPAGFSAARGAARTIMRPPSPEEERHADTDDDLHAGPAGASEGRAEFADADPAQMPSAPLNGPEDGGSATPAAAVGGPPEADLAAGRRRAEAEQAYPIPQPQVVLDARRGAPAAPDGPVPPAQGAARELGVKGQTTADAGHGAPLAQPPAAASSAPSSRPTQALQVPPSDRAVTGERQAARLDAIDLRNPTQSTAGGGLGDPAEAALPGKTVAPEREPRDPSGPPALTGVRASGGATAKDGMGATPRAVARPFAGDPDRAGATATLPDGRSAIESGGTARPDARVVSFSGGGEGPATAPPERPATLQLYGSGDGPGRQIAVAGPRSLSPESMSGGRAGAPAQAAGETATPPGVPASSRNGPQPPFHSAAQAAAHPGLLPGTAPPKPLRLTADAPARDLSDLAQRRVDGGRDLARLEPAGTRPQVRTAPPPPGAAAADLVDATREKPVIPSGDPLHGAAPQPGAMSQGSSAPATPAPAASVPQLAQGAAQAIVSGLAGAPEADRSAGVEISLDPPELGRVRMSFVEVGGTVVLSILAERPETAELMRRHLDILGQEFARAGLEAPSVRVDSNGDQGFGRNDAKPDADGHGPAPGAGETGAGTGTPETATGTLRPGMSGHALDLRL